MDRAGPGATGLGASETGALASQEQLPQASAGPPQHLPAFAGLAVNGCHTTKNANKMAATDFTYFFDFFPASSSFFKYLSGFLLKSFLHDSQHNFTSRPL